MLKIKGISFFGFKVKYSVAKNILACWAILHSTRYFISSPLRGRERKRGRKKKIGETLNIWLH